MVPNETLIWGRFHNWLTSNLKLHLSAKDATEIHKRLVSVDLDLWSLFCLFCVTQSPEIVSRASATLTNSLESYIESRKRCEEQFRVSFMSLGDGDLMEQCLRIFDDWDYFLDTEYRLYGEGLPDTLFKEKLHKLSSMLGTLSPLRRYGSDEHQYVSDEVVLMHALLYSQRSVDGWRRVKEHIKELAKKAFQEDINEVDIVSPGMVASMSEFPAKYRDYAITAISQIIFSLGEMSVPCTESDSEERKTTLHFFLDPRLPDTIWKMAYELLDRRMLISPETEKRNWWLFDEGTESVQVVVQDEVSFLSHFVPKGRQKAAKKTWARIRDEILKQALSDDERLQPFYVAFCEHAKLEAIEKRVRDADLLCSQEKYIAAAGMCRQVAESLFKLMTGEPEEAPVDSKRIWNRKETIAKTYGDPVFHDLVNVWKHGSRLVHHPEENEAEMCYKVRDIVGRTAHLWNMFKQRHFEYYGLPMTWQSSTEDE